MTAMPRLYRLLQYVADPFTGRRISIAALIRETDGTTRVVMTSAAPDPEELGSVRAANLLASLRRDIAGLAAFDALPRSFGPQLILTSPEPVPADDPVVWVRARLGWAVA